MTYAVIRVFVIAVPALVIWVAAFRFLPFLRRIAREESAMRSLDRQCVCGHRADEHSPCTPMGCTRCDCWRTSVWIP